MRSQFKKEIKQMA